MQPIFSGVKYLVHMFLYIVRKEKEERRRYVYFELIKVYELGTKLKIYFKRLRKNLCITMTSGNFKPIR